MSDELVLRMKRVIPATPEMVFDAWTKPEILTKWWGPEGMTTPEYSLDVRQGGAWRTVMRSPDGQDHICSGVYREINRPKRLAFTWAWQQEDGSRGHETIIELEFAPHDGGTLMQLTQGEFAEQQWRDKHEGGWASSFNCLVQLFQKKAAA